MAPTYREYCALARLNTLSLRLLFAFTLVRAREPHLARHGRRATLLFLSSRAIRSLGCEVLLFFLETSVPRPASSRMRCTAKGLSRQGQQPYSSVRSVIRDTNPRGYLESTCSRESAISPGNENRQTLLVRSFCYLARLSS